MRGKSGLLILVLLASASWITITQAADRTVPDPYVQIGLAVQAANSGEDRVIVCDVSYSHSGRYYPFTLDKNIPVINTSGQEVIVDAADTANYAARVTATGASVEGLTLRGGTVATAYLDSGTLLNCAVEQGAGSATRGVYAGSMGATAPIIQGCTVTLTDTTSSIGIHDDAAGATILDNTVSVPHGYGILLNYSFGSVDSCRVAVGRGDGIHAYDCVLDITGCAVAVTGAGSISDRGIYAELLDGRIQDCFVTIPGGLGIYPLDGETMVLRCTVDGAAFGVYTPGAEAVEHSIAANCSVWGFSCSPPASYCIATGYQGGYDQGSKGTGSVEEDPLFCDPGSGEYTLRVDSYGNPGNNPSGERIGAFPVACMYGTLARSSVFVPEGAGPAYLHMFGSTTVPTDSSLSIGGDVTVSVATTSPLTKLEVEGHLEIAGNAIDPVRFTSAGSTPAEGDWYGIELKSSATAAVDFADIEYATYGVDDQSGHPVTITNSTFANNGTYDIVAGDNVADGLPLTISHNTIHVGGGTGIELMSGIDGAAVDTNTVQGTETSTGGIELGQFAHGTVSIIGNSLGGYGTGMTAGSGIHGNTATSIITGNAISYNKYGINLGGGSATVGGTSAASTNVISHSSTAGLAVQGTGTDPLVRHNEFSSNVYGVVAKYGADPDLGQSSGDRGLNKFLSNTTYCIWNRNASGTLAAEYNYFGACSGGAPDICWNGNVDASNAYCTAPWGKLDVTISRVNGEPKGFRVLGAAPNPTSGPGQLFFSLEEGTAKVRVEIFDLAGRVIRDFGTLEVGPGEHQVHWDGRNEQGQSVGSGIYFIRMTTNTQDRGTAKILVTR